MQVAVDLEGLVVLALCAVIWPETRRTTVLVRYPADADDEAISDVPAAARHRVRVGFHG